jgi:hypothetical protein
VIIAKTGAAIYGKKNSKTSPANDPLTAKAPIDPKTNKIMAIFTGRFIWGVDTYNKRKIISISGIPHIGTKRPDNPQTHSTASHRVCRIKKVNKRLKTSISRMPRNGTK